ncbi:MAG: flagellar biosynthetic protein FliQ [Phycisphaerae bacterium]|nr:flagellar biosynthetic protein FliQ [Phycisphaerae bacterium]HAW95706.1 flagellar biosynthetic protein FliQ [Phycisphaerales bacterium]|tara:strand:- start:873 stop:1121 length:249 start_codon:yes stop_codon:yes gene_type:complete
MDTENLALVREALMITLLVSAPILGAGLLVGLVISLLQAVTQVQEQTLAFVPKIVAMVLVAVLLLGWIGGQISVFAERMFGG